MALLGSLNTGPHLRFVTNVFYAYLTLRIVGWDFVTNIEKAITGLALISLPLYALQLINHDLVLTIINAIESLIPVPETRGGVDLIHEYANAIFYTVWIEGENSGFMWEPGAFAAVLSVGVWLNLVLNDFKINRGLIILFLALVSTLTTAAAILAFLLLLFYIYNQNSKLVYLPIIFATGFGLYSLDFVSEKIMLQLEDPDKIRKNEYHLYRNAGVENSSLGRFGSLIVDFEDLSQNYAFGVGFEYELRTQGKYLNFDKTNGLSDYIVKFGLIGFVILLVSQFHTAQRVSERYRHKGKAFFPFMIMILSFSNPVLFTPLFLSFQLFPISIDPLENELTDEQTELVTQ